MSKKWGAIQKYFTEWFPFIRSKFLEKDEFKVNDEFKSYLNDAGAPFTHPRKSRITLNDIFVYPDLKELNLQSEPKWELLQQKFIDYILENRKIIIIGAGYSGKTTLSKKIYSELLNYGITPVLVNGSDIKSGKEEKYLNLVKKCFIKQYHQNLWEKYNQFDKVKKAILVDDFNKARLNRKGKADFITTLDKFADTIILFCDDWFLSKEILEQVYYYGTAPFPEFKICEIRPFGYYLREKIIKKWLTLGAELTIDSDELIRKTDEMQKTINTIIRENLMPCYPIFVLSILQTIEAITPLKTVYGSYGYFYEMMITQALAKVFHKEDIDMAYNYLSELAWYIFSNNLLEINSLNLDTFDKKYESIYAMRVPSEKMRENLVKSGILDKLYGIYGFKYKFIYYYFIARYIRDHMHRKETENEMKKWIEKMSKAVFKEDYANILIFLSYLSKDDFIIEEMIKSTKQIFKDYEMCDLNKDIKFLETLPISPPEVIVENKDVEKSREEYLKVKDEIKAKMDEFENTEEKKETQIDEIIKFDSAIKSLEILGQVLRNFASSLKAEEKFKLAEECYFIGLRTLKIFISIIEENLDIFRDIVRKMIYRFLMGKKELDRRNLEKRVNLFIFLFILKFSYWFIKKISYSVGSKKLEKTYEEVLKKYNNLRSVQLTDLSIKLDHFTFIPEKQIIKLYEEVKNNVFLSTFIRLMIKEHFYMFPVKYEIRQKLCSKLNISTRDPKFLNIKSKKFKPKLK